MRIICVIITLLVFSSCGTSPQKDIDRIVENLCCQTVENGVSDDVVSDLLSTISADGSWPSINYLDGTRSDWDVANHVRHLKKLAIAYNLASSSYCGSKEVLEKYLLAYDFYTNLKPVCPNWWFNEIGVPNDWGPAMLLMLPHLSKARVDAGCEVLGKAHFGMTGTNKVWLAIGVMMKALAEGDFDTVVKAHDEIVSEIHISERSEGIRPDWSFHQHGPLLQIGNYGCHWVENMSFGSSLFVGTSLAFTDEQLDIIHNFFFRGILPSIYNGGLDMNAQARQVIKDAQYVKADRLASCARTLAVVDARHSEDYTAAADAISFRTNLSCQVGAFYYPYSDYGVFRTPTWSATYRMNSLRTFGYETTNSENLRGYYSADGAMLVQVDGTEFLNIPPVWNWHLVPGTTTCQGGPEPWGNVATKLLNLTDNVTGWIDEEGYLWTAFEYHKDGVFAHKVNFFTPFWIASWGSDISCTSRGGEVVTCVAQSLASGAVYVSADGRRVWHRGIGYINAGEGAFEARIVDRKGDWHDIMAYYPSEEAEAPMFTLTLSHGRHPKSASYAYITVPAVSLEDFVAMETPVVATPSIHWDELEKMPSSTIDDIQEDKGGLYK